MFDIKIKRQFQTWWYPEQIAAVQGAAKELGLSTTALIRDVVLDYVNRLPEQKEKRNASL